MLRNLIFLSSFVVIFACASFAHDACTIRLQAVDEITPKLSEFRAYAMAIEILDKDAVNREFLREVLELYTHSFDTSRSLGRDNIKHAVFNREIESMRKSFRRRLDSLLNMTSPQSDNFMIIDWQDPNRVTKREVRDAVKAVLDDVKTKLEKDFINTNTGVGREPTYDEFLDLAVEYTFALSLTDSQGFVKPENVHFINRGPNVPRDKADLQIHTPVGFLTLAEIKRNLRKELLWNRERVLVIPTTRKIFMTDFNVVSSFPIVFLGMPETAKTFDGLKGKKSPIFSLYHDIIHGNEKLDNMGEMLAFGADKDILLRHITNGIIFYSTVKKQAQYLRTRARQALETVWFFATHEDFRRERPWNFTNFNQASRGFDLSPSSHSSRWPEFMERLTQDFAKDFTSLKFFASRNEERAIKVLESARDLILDVLQSLKKESKREQAA